MSDVVLVALITAVGGVISGALGKVGYDKLRNTRSHSSNGNGSIERVIATRAEVEFQTHTKLLLQDLTRAIERGHDKALLQMETVSVAINQAAQALRDIHKEIQEQGRDMRPVIEDAAESRRVVRIIHDELRRRAI